MHFCIGAFFAHGHQCEKPYMEVFYIWNMSTKADGCPARRAVEKDIPLLNYPNLKRRRNSPKGSKKEEK